MLPVCIVRLAGHYVLKVHLLENLCLHMPQGLLKLNCIILKHHMFDSNNNNDKNYC